jgi:hypothetical protein
VSLRLFLQILLVAPGVAVHEFGHLALCRLSGVPVRQVVLFRIGAPAGFVSHAAPRLLRQHLAISSGPLLVSSLLAGLLFIAAARFCLDRPEPWWPAGLLLSFWLGWSIALEAWPSGGDASALRRSAAVQLRQLNPGAAIALPIAIGLSAANAARRLGWHWLYAALLAFGAVRVAAW